MGKKEGRGRGGGGGGGGGGRGPGGWGGRMPAGLRPVDETTRIDIAAMLADFQASDATQFTFPPGLSNHDRAVVHAECRKYGFTSKSKGKDNESKGTYRQVSVFKPKQRGKVETVELSVTDTTLQSLAEYAAQFPERPGEAAEGEGGGGRRKQPRGQGEDGSDPPEEKRRRGAGRGAPQSPDEVRRRHQEWEARIQSPQLADVARTRLGLPIMAHREEILSAVRQNSVILIAGETGCGKTTQVPQYLLEDCWAAGEPCRILCTQPRRISAVSVSERVAAERGEKIGSTVGYAIRLDTKASDSTSLLFQTNGVLLRQLTVGDSLAGVTHVIVDEIHERDKFADFLLIMLRDLVRTTRPDLKIILMSATLHTELFSDYFGGCPIVRVPGFTHPVEDLYLEDILKITGYHEHNKIRPVVAERPGRLSKRAEEEIEKAIEDAFLVGGDAEFDRLLDLCGAADFRDASAGCPGVNHAHPATGATALMAAAGKGRLEAALVLLANGADAKAKSRDGATAYDWAERFGHHDVSSALKEHLEDRVRQEEAEKEALALSHYQMNTDSEEVDLDLVAALIRHLQTGDQGQPLIEGAILVFCPGWDEIATLRDMLENDGNPGLWVLPLHSMVPPQDQKKVFQRPLPGVTKVVLSTNIAETAVTIDDVVMIIDSGRVKENSYDPYTGVATLQSTWICKASERQRRGRAGRCRPGLAFHLYSKARSNALADFQLPEIKRSPLEELCLQVKLLGAAANAGEPLGPDQSAIAVFFGKAVEPPVTQQTVQAVQLLKDIGALDEGENLTVLGRHLARLPLPPRIGKMLLYACMFRVLDPILTVACMGAYRDPFVLPMESSAKRAAKEVKHRLSDEWGGGSDQLAAAAAYAKWVESKAKGFERPFLNRNFLSGSTLNMVDGMRNQLIQELAGMKILPDATPASLRAFSLNAGAGGIVRGVMSLGLYPQIGRLAFPYNGKMRRCMPTVLTRRGEKVKIHLGSVNYALDPPFDRKELMEQRRASPGSHIPLPSAILSWDELIRVEGHLNVRACTVVQPHGFLLACHRFEVSSYVPRPPKNYSYMGEGPDDYIDSDSDDEDAEDEEDDEDDEVWAEETDFVMADSWVRFMVPGGKKVTGPLRLLRMRLAAAFESLVLRPGQQLLVEQYQAVKTIQTVFRVEEEANRQPQPRGGPPVGMGGQGQGRGGRFGGRGGRGEGRQSGYNSREPSRSGPSDQYGRGRGGYNGGGGGGGGRGGYGAPAPPPGGAGNQWYSGPSTQQGPPAFAGWVDTFGDQGQGQGQGRGGGGGDGRTWQQDEMGGGGRGRGRGGQGQGGRGGGGRGPGSPGGYGRGRGGGGGGGGRGGGRGRYGNGGNANGYGENDGPAGGRGGRY